jgi:hypothetical protein
LDLAWRENAVIRKKADELEKRTVVPVTVTPPPPPGPAVIVDEGLVNLKAQLEKRHSKPLYTIEKQTDMQVGAGRIGSYYLIELLDPVAKTSIRFADGKYTLSGGDEAFETAFSEVVRDIISAFDSHARYEFFIRAKADERRILNPSRLPDQGAFRVVRYLPRAECNRYLGNVSEQTLGDRVRNENLPILRAAYLRNLITTQLTGLRRTSSEQPLATILEGVIAGQPNAVCKGDSDKPLSAEILLFVDW